MISSLAWIPRGAAKPAPTDVQLSDLPEGDDEGSEPSSAMDDDKVEVGQVVRARAFAEALKASSGGGDTSSLDAAMAELGMDTYDEGGEEGSAPAGLFGSGHPGMAFYRSNEEDPYITLEGNEDDASERDEDGFKPSDLLILAARNEDDVSHLEVWVYEEADNAGPSNLYVHHDVLLATFPLALAWLDCRPGGAAGPGNFAAVGTIGPGIEIWDLDLLDAVEPAATLGGERPDAAGPSGTDACEEDAKTGNANKAKKKKAKRRKELAPGSHAGAVLGLAWNPAFRNVLASASADRSVKVWDVATGVCDQTLGHHAGKVQAVAWNPAEPSVLLSGGFDQAVFLADVRTQEAAAARWALSGDAEALVWAPAAPATFLASSEDGVVAAYDARRGPGGPPLFRLSAHDAPACALSFSPTVPGLLATASTDKQVKLWDVSNDRPSLVASESLGVGATFAASFSSDAPHLLAAGGSMGAVAVWDILTSAAVLKRYGRLFKDANKYAEAADGPAVTSL